MIKLVPQVLSAASIMQFARVLRAAGEQATGASVSIGTLLIKPKRRRTRKREIFWKQVVRLLSLVLPISCDCSEYFEHVPIGWIALIMSAAAVVVA